MHFHQRVLFLVHDRPHYYENKKYENTINPYLKDIYMACTFSAWKAS
jgi:hypothetical protein